MPTPNLPFLLAAAVGCVSFGSSSAEPLADVGPARIPVPPGAGPEPWASAGWACTVDRGSDDPIECEQRVVVPIGSATLDDDAQYPIDTSNLGWGSRDGVTCSREAVKRAGANITRELCIDLELRPGKRPRSLGATSEPDDPALVECVLTQLREAERTPREGPDANVRQCLRYVSRVRDEAIPAFGDRWDGPLARAWGDRPFARPLPDGAERYDLQIGPPIGTSENLADVGAAHYRWEPVERPEATGVAAGAIAALATRAGGCAALFDELTGGRYTLGLTSQVYLVGDQVHEIDVSSRGALHKLAECIEEGAPRGTGTLPNGALVVELPLHLARR